MRTLLPIWAISLGLLGCVEDGDIASGASEPIQVRDAVFHTGDLPVDEAAATPEVINVGAVSSLVWQGMSNIAYTGLVSKDAYAVGITFPSVSSGYWVLPAGGPDVTQDNNLGFDAIVDFSPEVPYGLQLVRFVALGEGGTPGPAFDVEICVLPDIADNSLAFCDPEAEARSAVLSLQWDTQVDLDLLVLVPNGKMVSAKAPTTVVVEGAASVPNEALADPTVGKLSRDSNRDCQIDGVRVESLVFSGEPPPGEYYLFASLHSACGESSVNFEARAYQRVTDGGAEPVRSVELGHGQLLALHADGGESPGTYIGSITLPIPD
jgi:hypothetical protein